MISGMMEKIISVSHMLKEPKMMNDTTILMVEINSSSGQWWANSVTSNKSFVIRDIIWPTFVLS